MRIISISFPYVTDLNMTQQKRIRYIFEERQFTFVRIRYRNRRLSAMIREINTNHLSRSDLSNLYKRVSSLVKREENLDYHIIIVIWRVIFRSSCDTGGGTVGIRSYLSVISNFSAGTCSSGFSRSYSQLMMLIKSAIFNQLLLVFFDYSKWTIHCWVGFRIDLSSFFTRRLRLVYLFVLRGFNENGTDN